MTWPVALTIGGSDASGGAGIQADLATFAVSGVFGTSALTRVTVQNTRGVRDVSSLAPAFVQAQIGAVLDDVPVRAAKTGSLGSAATIGAVAEILRARGPRLLVVDPVAVAKSGATLLDASGLQALTAELVTLATVLTPNVREAEALLGRNIRDQTTAAEAAGCLLEMMTRGAEPGGPERVVVITRIPDHHGATDLVCSESGVELLTGDAIAGAPTHGAGCVFSAAITAALAQGESTLDAIVIAKRFVTEAIRRGLRLSPGRGPVSPARAWSSRWPPHLERSREREEENTHV